jgi:hypothetical protein
MRRNRSLYLTILLLLVLGAGAAQAETPSEWDDGSASLTEMVCFGPADAADLKDELDHQLRVIRSRRARIAAAEVGSRIDELARELLEQEMRLLVASAGIADVAVGAVRDPAEVASRFDEARAAVAAVLATQPMGAV